MTITMNDSPIDTIEDLQKFLQQKSKVQFQYQNKKEAYVWIQEVLVKFEYLSLSKAAKGLIRTSIGTLSGYSRAPITRLMTQYRQTGLVELADYQHPNSPQKYS